MKEVSMENLENEIENQQRNVSYDTKEYTIEIIVQKYLNDLEKEENEFLYQSISGNLFGIIIANHVLLNL